MSKLRYNRTFKKGLITCLICFLLFGFVIGSFVVSKIQYNSLISDMKSVEATIVDIDLDIHVRGPDEQEIYITYEVDGVAYSRELKTDTAISFSAGTGANYSIGDKIEIFYNPDNPEVIASPRSVGVGYFYLVIGLSGLALVSFALFCAIKNHRKFLVTQEEYEKEKEELKNIKSEKKKQKKQKKLEKQKKYTKVRKVIKIVLIVLGALMAAFIFYLLFGLLLMALGY